MGNEIKETKFVTTAEIKKLWQLVELSTADLKYFLSLEGFTINMGLWVQVDKAGNPCAACLGGCFLLRHTKPLKGATDTSSLSAYSEKDGTLADVLDSVRINAVHLAMLTFYNEFIEERLPADYNDQLESYDTRVELFKPISFYDDDTREGFIAYLGRVVDYLKEKDW